VFGSAEPHRGLEPIAAVASFVYVHQEPGRLARQAVSPSTVEYEEQPSMVVEGGVSLKHASVVPAARILVIDDNRSDVFLLERALKKQDLRFELIHLLDGGEAFAYIRRQGAYHEAAIPDLILLDLNLPKHTAEEITREIRTVKHLVSVPVCVWSSSGSRRDQSLLQYPGVVRFITKPSGLDQFMEIGIIIKDLLAGSQRQLTA
jgi:chemotaxis family two-component system response regulator Rcp1